MPLALSSSEVDFQLGRISTGDDGAREYNLSVTAFMEYPASEAASLRLDAGELITLAHFSVSSTTNFSNSEGVMDIGATPRSASRPEILGSASPAFITPLSRSIGPGRRDRVPLGRGSNPNPGEKPTSEPQFPKWNRGNHFAADVPSPTVG